MEIDKGRGNAILLLGRALNYLEKNVSLKIIDIQGGTANNSIPSHASAEILIRKEDISIINQLVKSVQAIYAEEYKLTDDQVNVIFSPEVRPGIRQVLTKETASRLLTTLMNLPNGVQKMSFALEGLVQTSLNLGKAITRDTEILFSCSVRSSLNTEKDHLVDQIRQLMESLGGSISCSGGYPAWEYRADSPLRRLMVKVFEDQYGRRPEVTMIHAGVECGIFSGKIDDLDCISIGPDMEGIHSPAEALDIASVSRVWDYLLEVLSRMTREQ